MRKVYVVVTVRLIIQQEDGVDTTEVLQEMEYDFKSITEGAEIIDDEIRDWNVEDST